MLFNFQGPSLSFEISSLETEMKNAEDMSLAVSFLLDGQPFKVSREGVAYYPISYCFLHLLG